jgi:hypothetical protein
MNCCQGCGAPEGEGRIRRKRTRGKSKPRPEKVVLRSVLLGEKRMILCGNCGDEAALINTRLAIDHMHVGSLL